MEIPWRYEMKKITGIYLLMVASVMGSNFVMASDGKRYSLTITNATAQHVITPPLIVIHHKGYQLFEVAKPASEGLATLAESGNNSILAGEVAGSSGVVKVIQGSAPIVYGNSKTFYFNAPKRARVSLAGMLATTNDAFAAVSGVALPRKSVSYMAETYDAGSEDNNELCIDIPGPPCGGTNATIVGDGEGFVTIHNGVSGVGNLNPAQLDWRGATAIVTIKRVKK